MIHLFTHRKYISVHMTSYLNWWKILFQSWVCLNKLTALAAVLPSKSDAKLEEEEELMNDRNINTVLEGTYKALCEALNW
jgi:hypothetical protein